MNISTKNKNLALFFTILVCISFGDVLAEPKTWTKDALGRALIYRAEPSQVTLAVLIAFTGCSAGITLGGILSKFPPKDNRFMTLCGSLFTALGAYGTWQWYHDYESRFKPLIIIDRVGIAYEGKDKILWKRVCGYREMMRTIYHGNGVVTQENYLEISTDVDKFEIHENKIAITLPMLLKLIDEGYKSYQELEKQRKQASQTDNN